MAPTDLRRYSAQAHSTETFGRVLCSARTQHFVADGPVQNGCPGEALSPGELFLAGVASCGVELVQVIAADVRRVAREIAGALDWMLGVAVTSLSPWPSGRCYRLGGRFAF